VSQQYDTWYRSFLAGEAISQFDQVYLTAANTVSIADLTNRPIGVAQHAAASGEPVTVKLLYPTYKVRAEEAFAVGATLYTEAGGTVQDTAASTSLPIYTALEAATASGDIVEAIPIHYGGVAAS
jgi:hypothetical protein